MAAQANSLSRLNASDLKVMRRQLEQALRDLPAHAPVRETLAAKLELVLEAENSGGNEHGGDD